MAFPIINCYKLNFLNSYLTVVWFLRAVCSLRKDAGPCLDYTALWYYDAETAICRRFLYGGCGGNRNRFGTARQCREHCAAAEHDDVTGKPDDVTEKPDDVTEKPDDATKNPWWGDRASEKPDSTEDSESTDEDVNEIHEDVTEPTVESITGMWFV